MIKAIPFVALLVVAASPCFAQLYMDAGRTVYEFDLGGNLVASSDFDTPGHLGQGLSYGPDNRLYIAVAAGTARVDRYNSDLSGYLNSYVANFQGGLSGPVGDAFGTDGNLYVASQGTSSIDRFYGPVAGQQQPKCWP